jgi:hypothetical protein
MSLLHQNPAEEVDDAALGESFTKGSSHLVWASVAAAVLVSLCVAIYFLADRRPPTVTGDILQVSARPLHIKGPGIDASGAPVAVEEFEQMLVITHVQLHNQGKEPLLLHEVLTNAKLDDGIHSSYVAIADDYERIFQAYPELAALHGPAIPTHITINPGQTVEGNVVSAFRITKQQWDARKGLNYTFGFRYQPNLVLTPRAAVID